MSVLDWFASLVDDLTQSHQLTQEEIDVHVDLIQDGDYDAAELYLAQRGFMCLIDVQYNGEYTFEYHRLV